MRQTDEHKQGTTASLWAVPKRVSPESSSSPAGIVASTVGRDLRTSMEKAVLRRYRGEGRSREETERRREEHSGPVLANTSAEAERFET